MIMKQMPTKASGYNKIQRSMNHFEIDEESTAISQLAPAHNYK